MRAYRIGITAGKSGYSLGALFTEVLVIAEDIYGAMVKVSGHVEALRDGLESAGLNGDHPARITAINEQNGQVLMGEVVVNSEVLQRWVSGFVKAYKRNG